MSYQRPDGSTVHFVRPVHSIIALHGADVVALNALGLSAGRNTCCHRFLSAGNVTINHADDYNRALKKKVKSPQTSRNVKNKSAKLCSPKPMATKS